jgi:dynein light chain Tctex-type 1
MAASKANDFLCPHAYDFNDMQDDVSAVVKNAILDALNGQVFQQRNVQTWIDEIGDNSLKGLKALNENFKLVVSCFISEKTGAGVCASVTSLWNEKTDGCCTIKWQNSSMQCIVTVFGTAL